MIKLESYIPIMEFLSHFLGRDYELILCDSKKILHIENLLGSGNQIGTSIDSAQQTFFHNQEYENLPFIMDCSHSSATGSLKSGTLFLRDNKKIIGFLTINTRLDRLLDMRNLLDSLIGDKRDSTSGDTPKNEQQKKSPLDTMALSVSEIMDGVISDAAARFSTRPERFTTEEKLSIIREMDKRGVFKVKGTVSKIAPKLYSSEATIYRYLHQISK